MALVSILIVIVICLLGSSRVRRLFESFERARNEAAYLTRTDIRSPKEMEARRNRICLVRRVDRDLCQQGDVVLHQKMLISSEKYQYMGGGQKSLRISSLDGFARCL